MALKWKGRVRETSITTGTGALTLGGAVTSYGTFASLMSTGDTCYGTVAHRTTTEWEDCLFTMAADGTLQRTTVIDGSSGAGVPVSLSAGTKDVFLGLPPAIVETLLGASLVTLGTASYITSERVLTAGSGITLTDGGAGSTLTIAASGGGTVTSVAMTVPTILSVAGSPVTTSGTLAVTLATQAANIFLAGPTSGGAATPAFRSLVSADIPDLSATYAAASHTHDHGTGLTGLTDDDHTQYVLLAPTTDARNVITPTADTVKGLVLAPFSSTQSDNLLEIRDSAGTARIKAVSKGTAVDTSYLEFTSSTKTVQVGVWFNGNFAIDCTVGAGACNFEINVDASFIIYHAGTASSQWGASDVRWRTLYGFYWTTNAVTSSLDVGFDHGYNGTGTGYIRVSECGGVSGTDVAILVCGNTDSGTNAVTTGLIVAHNTDGTPAAGFGVGIQFDLESSTTVVNTAGKITSRWGVATHASREGIVAIIATDYNGDRTGFEVTGNGSATEIGFYGVTPVARPSTWTQTYSTATKTHSNLTSAALTVADGAGTNDGTIGAITADASVIAAVQELADQVNKLIVDVANVKQVVNSLIDDLQSLGLAQ